MLELGTLAPNFSLTDVLSGKPISLNNNYQATVIMFICNHCPYVKHIQQELVNLANDFIPKNIRFIAINSNDTTQYPEDSPEKMREIGINLAYPFPYVFDATQEVARAYQATCTPDFFIFDKNLSLVYRGQLDDSRPGNNIDVTGESIRNTLQCLINNKPVDTTQKPSIGCNIKWMQNH